MVNDPKGARIRAEARIDKAKRTSDEARYVADADLGEARTKTERLRRLRLTREAGEGVTGSRQGAGRSKEAQGDSPGVRLRKEAPDGR